MQDVATPNASLPRNRYAQWAAAECRFKRDYFGTKGIPPKVRQRFMSIDARLLQDIAAEVDASPFR